MNITNKILFYGKIKDFNDLKFIIYNNILKVKIIKNNIIFIINISIYTY